MKLENDLNRQSQSGYVNGQKTQGNILNIAILARAFKRNRSNMIIHI